MPKKEDKKRIKIEPKEAREIFSTIVSKSGEPKKENLENEPSESRTSETN